MRYARDTNEIRARYARDTSEIRARYARDTRVRMAVWGGLADLADCIVVQIELEEAGHMLLQHGDILKPAGWDRDLRHVD